MDWNDTPDSRQAFIAEAQQMVSDAGGVKALVDKAVEAWQYLKEGKSLDPASLNREELEQAFIRAMHAAWHLARLNFAMNGSLLDGGDARRYNASKGGTGKILKNPKASAKAEAKKGALRLWIERDAGMHPRLSTVEKFATEVMHRWPVLTSSKVICGWSTKWTKQARAGKNPAC